jgi:hypothetical protein
MRPLLYRIAAVICTIALVACAHLVNVLDTVKPGMTREQAVGSAQGNPTPYYVIGASTEYVLFRVVTNLYSMYGEQPHEVLFIRIENGKVTEKGVVGAAEEDRIRKIRPTFSLREWRGTGSVLSDTVPTH